MTTQLAENEQDQELAGFGDLPRLMARQMGDEKHEPSATSTLSALWVLYDRILRVDPARPLDPMRDRFMLSKGHGPQAYYAVLAAKGFIAPELLSGFGSFDSPLGTHPDRNLIAGVEISSGSLGHGLPIAVGSALALRISRNLESRVFCMMGDGELDEGSNHEAIAVAARFGLDRLTAIVIDNASSAHGWPGGIASRFTTEGWTAITVDAQDHDALADALSGTSVDTPVDTPVDAPVDALVDASLDTSSTPSPHRPHAVVAVVDAGS